MLPTVYPIVDTATLAQFDFDVVEFAAALLDGGARLLQFRHKGPFEARQIEQLHAVAALCRDMGAQLVVNDRADMAKLVDAGLHIGQGDMNPAQARAIVGAAMLGLSTGNVEQMRAARSEPVDYVALGPIFATNSKADADPAVGLTILKACRTLTARPLVAIGGITLDNARGVLDAGADSVAVIRGMIPGGADRDRTWPSQVRARMGEWLAEAGA